MNTALLLDMVADTWPRRAALSCAGRTLTWQALRELAVATAGRVRAHGARSLAFLDVNGAAAAVAMYAAARAGVPYAPLSYRLSRSEIEALLARLDAPLIVRPSRGFGSLAVPAGAVSVDGAALLEPLPANPTQESHADPDPDAVAVQLFTSGTTGEPKAALLRHAHLAAYVLASVEFGSASEDEATLIAVPPYHVAGIAAMLTSTYAARRMVIQPEFDAAGWLAIAASERVTQAFVVPTMLARIDEQLRQSQAAAPATLRAIAYGGGVMPRPVIERAMQRFPGAGFTNAYGLTETSSTICLLDPEDHRTAAGSEDPTVRARLSSVGRPLPSVEVEVRDETGAPLAAGQVGLVFVRGPQVSGEYRDSGSQLDAGGWFATRDRGWIDPEGYVYLDGRADDMIVRGGENISPGEIESVLREHSAVADAAVLAVPSEEWGEAIGAVVVLKQAQGTSVADLKCWVRERLRSSRVPEQVLFRERLPYNDMGKLLRRELRREFGGLA